MGFIFLKSLIPDEGSCLASFQDITIEDIANNEAASDDSYGANEECCVSCNSENSCSTRKRSLTNCHTFITCTVICRIHVKSRAKVTSGIKRHCRVRRAVCHMTETSPSGSLSLEKSSGCRLWPTTVPRNWVRYGSIAAEPWRFDSHVMCDGIGPASHDCGNFQNVCKLPTKAPKILCISTLRPIPF